MKISYMAVPGIKVNFSGLLNVICKKRGLERSEVVCPSRKREVVTARHLYYYFARKYFPSFSVSTIAEETSRDHATALHGIKTINNLMETNTQFREEVLLLEDEIKYYLK